MIVTKPSVCVGSRTATHSKIMFETRELLCMTCDELLLLFAGTIMMLVVIYWQRSQIRQNSVLPQDSTRPSSTIQHLTDPPVKRVDFENFVQPVLKPVSTAPDHSNIIIVKKRMTDLIHSSTITKHGYKTKWMAMRMKRYTCTMYLYNVLVQHCVFGFIMCSQVSIILGYCFQQSSKPVSKIIYAS